MKNNVIDYALNPVPELYQLLRLAQFKFLPKFYYQPFNSPKLDYLGKSKLVTATDRL